MPVLRFPRPEKATPVSFSGSQGSFSVSRVLPFQWEVHRRRELLSGGAVLEPSLMEQHHLLTVAQTDARSLFGILPDSIADTKAEFTFLYRSLE